MNSSKTFNCDFAVKNLGFFGETHVNPLLTQVRTAYFSYDCGMCYVIRLCDGRFVIIDANSGEYEENERLFDVLSSQNVKEKIIIAAWFFSHAHLDHIGGFADFMTKYENEIILENVFYNWPDEDKTCPLDEHGKTVLAHFEEKIGEIREKAEIITAHSGSKYNFGGIAFEILFSSVSLNI